MRLSLLGLLTSLVLLPACGDEHDHDHEVDHEMCFGDEEALNAGAKLGESGLLQVEVLSTEPAALIVGDNTFTIRISDAEGMPITAATLPKAETWQRVHDHGTPIEPVITALQGPGEYRVEKMNIVHIGSWLFRFYPESGDESDFVEFNFGVQCAQ